MELTALTRGDRYNNRRLLARRGYIHQAEAEKCIMLPSETMIWQPEFTDKTLSREETGAVHIDDFVDFGRIQERQKQSANRKK